MTNGQFRKPSRIGMQKRFGASSLPESAIVAVAGAAHALLILAALSVLLLSCDHSGVVWCVLVAVLTVGLLVTASPSLKAHVVHVLKVGSNPKMGWVHAGRIVASMADRHLRRNILVVGQFPSVTMRIPSLAVDAEHAVSTAVGSAAPDPTLVGSGFVDVKPEALFARSLRFHIPALFIMAFGLSGCAMFAKPRAEPFHGKWEFCEIAPQRVMACLPEDDIAKLRETLIRCGAK